VKALSLVAAMGFGFAATSAAAADMGGPIQVVTALYGPRNESHQLDFTKRLQDTCGGASTYCEAFCSEAFVGRLDYGFIRLGLHPICRVVFRCGSLTTQTTEANKNETIALNCRQQQ
jgi:hypothetical protein